MGFYKFNILIKQISIKKIYFLTFFTFFKFYNSTKEIYQYLNQQFKITTRLRALDELSRKIFST